MNELEELYAGIMERGKSSVLENHEQLDLSMDDPKDTRMGLTLLIRPNKKIQTSIQDAIHQMRQIEPDQYYYPPEDFHITLFDIITGRSDFHYTREQREQAIALSEDILHQYSSFSINMKGLILSEGCVMATGFCPDVMQEIRNQLRQEITKYGFALDERYPTKSSHMTIARFRKKMVHRESFVKKILSLQQMDFGDLKVQEVELVCHNWYDSKKELIKTISLIR